MELNSTNSPDVKDLSPPASFFSVPMVAGGTALAAGALLVGGYLLGDLPSAPSSTLQALIVKAIKSGSSSLNLTGMSLKSFPQALADFEGEELNLSSNQLDRLVYVSWGMQYPFALQAFPNLKTLDLSSNNIDSEDFKELVAHLPPTLRTLKVDRNLIDEFPPRTSLRCMSSITHLSISRNSIRSVPAALESLLSLTHLDLQSNRIRSVTPRISSLTSLKSLSLSSNLLVSLPPLPFPALLRLEVSNNKLTSLCNLSSLTRLTSLLVGSNELDCLPDSFTDLTALRELQIHTNKFTSLPYVEHCRHLNSLTADGNAIESVDEDSGVFELTKLRVLSLNLNRITFVSPAISRLTSLQSLSLCGNDLAALPSELGTLKVLLRLRNNPRLLSLPIALIPLKREWDQPDRVQDHLYIGGAIAAREREGLLLRGVTHILQLIPGDFPFPGEFNYLKLELRDHHSQGIGRVLDSFVEWVEGVRKGGGVVLVHCQRGASRSASLIIAYLMATKLLSYKEALKYAKECRSIILPRHAFMKELRGYEKAEAHTPLEELVMEISEKQ